jgi:mRNA interferase MazF
VVTYSGIHRGEIWWAGLREPGYRRPILVVSSDDFNRSRIKTVLAVALTTNLRLAEAPGNILVAAEETGLSRDSVVNVSQVVTLDKSFLAERAGLVGERAMLAVENGLRTVLAL